MFFGPKGFVTLLHTDELGQFNNWEFLISKNLEAETLKNVNDFAVTYLHEYQERGSASSGLLRAKLLRDEI